MQTVAARSALQAARPLAAARPARAARLAAPRRSLVVRAAEEESVKATEGTYFYKGKSYSPAEVRPCGGGWFCPAARSPGLPHHTNCPPRRP